MRVDFSASAVMDLDDIIAYYVEQHVPEIGKQYVSEIVRHIETLPVIPIRIEVCSLSSPLRVNYQAF